MRRTPHAPPPRTARLRIFETQEVLGLVFAWWGINGRSTQWSLPEDPPNGTDLEPHGVQALPVPGPIPRKPTENAVDLAHLRFVHGYGNVQPVGTVSVQGAYLKSCFDFTRPRRIAGIFDVEFDTSVVTHVHGLGYSFVEIHEHSIGMEARLWVLATPVNSVEIELVLVSQVRDFPKPKRFVLGLGFVPLWLRTPMMNRAMIKAQERDVAQDVVIWERKQYLTRPRLSRADGEVAVYRRYCDQFLRGCPRPGGPGSAAFAVCLAASVTAAARVGPANYSRLVKPLERNTGNRSPSQAVGQGTPQEQVKQAVRGRPGPQGHG